MRVLHIAAGKHGGARIAAERLCNIQKLYGLHSEIYPSKQIFDKHRFVYLIESILSKSVTFLQKHWTKKPYGIFSTFSMSRRIEKSLRSQSYDLVHVHNWFNILSLREIIRISQKLPIIFTLHDERLLTGGCHNSLGCDRYQQKCINCPGVKIGSKLVEYNKRNIEKVFTRIEPYALIFPSTWLFMRAREENVFKYSKICKVIPNITSIEKNSTYQNFYLQKSKTQNEIVFVAADLNDPKKGLKILIDAINILADKGIDLHFHIVGKAGKFSRLKDIKVPHTIHGYLEEKLLNQLLDRVNIIVIPSLSENLPSVAIEGLKSNCIIVGTRVGGIPSLVKDNVTGFLANPNAKDISTKLEIALSLTGNTLKEMRIAITEFTNENFSTESIYEAHIELYKEVIGL